MSQYTDLVADIVTWTNRPLLTSEMDVAIRQAVNKLHRAGHFPRDLVTETVNVAIAEIQSIDYTAAPFVRYRRLATIGSVSYAAQYSIVDALDLFDVDGYARKDIAYVVGNNIWVKATAPQESYKVTYWQRPDVSNLSAMNDWLVAKHFDLTVLWAAATVLTAANENEIKTRVEKLAAIAYADLVGEELGSGGT